MNVDEMQRNLSQKAKKEPEHQFENLYGLLCNEVWLRVAHHSVNSNQGRETAGIDGKIMSNFNGDVEGNIKRLSEVLKAKTFEPMPVRRVYIPKAHGKERPLGIPTIDDRIVQEALRMALEPIWEADFSHHSYGFRPNRSTHDAITYIVKMLFSGQGYQWVIEGDIASYFDTIPHRSLIKAVKKRVADRNIRDLAWKFLRAGVMYRDKIYETLTGTPQGGIVSPLLANIYLHELDRHMESNYLLSEHQRRRRRREGKSNFLYARYADDFVVLCNGTKAQAQEMKEELGGFLSNKGLKLSEEKTKITHVTEGFKFLGYRVERSTGTKGKMVAKVLIPESAIKKFRHKVREILSPSSITDSASTKIQALNWLIRGWCEYYRSTISPSEVFRKVEYEVFWDMAHWLGKKYKLNMPEVMKKFRDGNTLRTKTMKLVRATEYKAKRLLLKTWHNPYTEKDEVIKEKARIKRESLFSYNKVWTGYEAREGWNDLREEIMLLKGTTCNLCGKELHPSEVEVDHIILRAKFKDPTEADRLSNLQVLCTECHRVKTKTDLKVLSRMR